MTHDFRKEADQIVSAYHEGGGKPVFSEYWLRSNIERELRTAYERGVEDAAKVADEADASMPIVKLQRKYAPSRSSHDQNEMRRLRQVHLQSQIMG